jgi:hypothetical protein
VHHGGRSTTSGSTAASLMRAPATGSFGAMRCWTMMRSARTARLPVDAVEAPAATVSAVRARCPSAGACGAWRGWPASGG